MAFLDLEDLTGITEVTVFSDLFVRSRDLLNSGHPVIVSGTREGDEESPKILAQEIYRIEDAVRYFCRTVHIRITTVGSDPEQVKELKRIFVRHKGRLPVKLHVVIPNKTETVVSLPSVTCDASEAFLSEIYNAFGHQSVSFDN